MTVSADLVSGILPVLPDGRFLLLQRATIGTWEPPAGRLVPGESFETGAIRELYEETGLLVTPASILATWVGERPGGGPLASVAYLGRTQDSEVRLSHEHLDYRWATIEEWLDLPSWWSRENIERAAAPLSSPSTDPLTQPPLPTPNPDARSVVRANLGAGTVVADLEGEEPRALLLRRRKSPSGLWENPGGMVEPGEDFLTCAHRETLEETGLKTNPETAWWARVEPWKSPEDPELYAGVGFLARYPGGEVSLEKDSHDTFVWVTEQEWRSLRTWYTKDESDTLWKAIRDLKGRCY